VSEPTPEMIEAAVSRFLHDRDAPALPLVECIKGALRAALAVSPTPRDETEWAEMEAALHEADQRGEEAVALLREARHWVRYQRGGVDLAQRIADFLSRQGGHDES